MANDPHTPSPPAAPRHAVYAAPAPDSPWWQAGSQWLGRCAATGSTLEPPEVPGFTPDELTRLTHEPRRYGWHATLKAPVTLAQGVSPQQWYDRMCTLANQCPPLALPPLVVRRLGHFLALVIDGDDQPVQALAAACVTRLHDLAAPLSASELARRRSAGLDARQEALLQQWGYPHVLDRFRFHFSLTGPLHGLSDAQVDRLMQAATDWFAPLPPLTLDRLAWFVEPMPGGLFRWEASCPLQGVDA